MDCASRWSWTAGAGRKLTPRRRCLSRAPCSSLARSARPICRVSQNTRRTDMSRGHVSVARSAGSRCLKAITNIAGQSARSRPNMSRGRSVTQKSAKFQRGRRAPLTSLDFLLENVLRAQKASSRGATPKPIARPVAPTSPEELPDDAKCPWCLKPFSTNRLDQKYCSRKCQIAASYEAQEASWRRERREALTCSDCGASLATTAKRRDTLYCPTCARARDDVARRRYREANREALNAKNRAARAERKAKREKA
jgi:hypothetical protein